MRRPPTFARVEELYHAALARPAAEREAFLDEECRGDEALLAEVRSLLDQEEEAKALLEEPAAGAATQKVAVVRGTRLGPYEVIELLGTGGMGEVYRARDARLGREVAVKVLPAEVAEDPQRLSLFEREARAVAALNHPNVLTVHDVGREDATSYVVTELLEGETLRELVSRRTPTVQQVLGYALEAARGLEAAHAKGIVHRDLKPENLFLTSEGRVKVLDFGLAKPVPGAAAGTVAVSATGPGVVMGTAAYMSPEQTRDQEVDARSDVFSFGVVLYELLAREHPFRKATVTGTLAAIAEETAPDLEEQGLRVPPAVGAIVRRCLEKDRKVRYASGHDLVVALEAVLARPSGAAALRDVGERNPYPGLRSFTAEDAEVFFGREREIAALWQKLERSPLLALIGPSGAGKTSFVRAGVVPKRPEGWGAVVCTPGSTPMRSLGRALAPELAADPEAATALLDFEDPEVALSLTDRWRRGHAEALVVLDQFEELFTQNPTEVQGEFATFVGRLTAEAGVHVLLSLRDDFLMRCHEHEPLAPVFTELTPLGALSREGLRRAVTQPAGKQGYAFEDDALVAGMLDAVEGARGALPLLAFAVARLWEKRDREAKRFTREAYAEIGGVAGALARHAEQTLERVGSERQGMVREIFRNLVTAQGTRAASDREELLSVFAERDAAEDVLSRLVDARLLTSYEATEPAGGAAAEWAESERAARPERPVHRIEIVHESLLTAWPRLVWWQSQDEEGAHLRDQLKQAARLWEEKDRSPDLLWSGAAFREFAVWRDRYPGKLTAVEEDFARSMASRARRRTRLRTAAVASVILVLAGVAIAIGVSRQEALESARRAEASRVLALAELRLEEDPTEALAYATASLELADTQEARVFALRALWEAPPAFDLTADEYVTAGVFSPDGTRLAAGGHGPYVRVWTEDGEGPVRLPGHGATPRGANIARWSSTGYLVTGHFASLVGSMHVWSAEGEHLRTIDFGGPTKWWVGPSHLLAETYPAERAEDFYGTGESYVVRLRSWRLPDGEARELGRVDRKALGATRCLIGPDGRSWIYARGREIRFRPLPLTEAGGDHLVARHPAEVVDLDQLEGRPGQVVSRDSSGEIRFWSLSPEGPVLEKRIPKPPSVSEWFYPGPSGQWILGTPKGERQARLWNVSALPGARPLVLRRAGAWGGIAFYFHPRSDWYVARTHGGTHLTFWPLPKANPSVVEGYSLLYRPLVFSPDGRWLATSWADGALRLWPLPGNDAHSVRILELPEQGLWYSLAFDPKGRYVVVVGNLDRGYLVPLDGGAPRKLRGFSEDTFLAAVGVSPSGRLVATAFGAGEGEKTLRVWDVETGELEVFDLPAGGDVLVRPAASMFHGESVFALRFVDDSTLLTSGPGGTRRWDLRTGAHELVESSFGLDILGALCGNGSVALTTMRYLERCHPVVSVDLETGAARTVARLGDCVEGLACDDTGTLAVSGDVEGVVRVGRLSDEEFHLLVGHEGAVTNVAISPDLKWVASAGEDNTLRLWPMPDLDEPPLHTLPHEELIAKLESLTNLRAVRDPESARGWKIEVGPFPGWRDVLTW